MYWCGDVNPCSEQDFGKKGGIPCFPKGMEVPEVVWPRQWQSPCLAVPVVNYPVWFESLREQSN